MPGKNHRQNGLTLGTRRISVRQRRNPSQPGATSQDSCSKNERGLKARSHLQMRVMARAFSPLSFSHSATWGVAPGWYGTGPLALCQSSACRTFARLESLHALCVSARRRSFSRSFSQSTWDVIMPRTCIRTPARYGCAAASRDPFRFCSSARSRSDRSSAR